MTLLINLYLLLNQNLKQEFWSETNTIEYETIIDCYIEDGGRYCLIVPDSEFDF